jgi:hypothetical protein
MQIGPIKWTSYVNGDMALGNGFRRLESALKNTDRAKRFLKTNLMFFNANYGGQDVSLNMLILCGKPHITKAGR